MTPSLPPARRARERACTDSMALEASSAYAPLAKRRVREAAQSKHVDKKGHILKKKKKTIDIPIVCVFLQKWFPYVLFICVYNTLFSVCEFLCGHENARCEKKKERKRGHGPGQLVTQALHHAGQLVPAELVAMGTSCRLLPGEQHEHRAHTHPIGRCSSIAPVFTSGPNRDHRSEKVHGLWAHALPSAGALSLPKPKRAASQETRRDNMPCHLIGVSFGWHSGQHLNLVGVVFQK